MSSAARPGRKTRTGSESNPEKSDRRMTEWFAINILGMPELASKNGQAVDDLIVYVHWLMIALFVGWIAYFCYVLWRFRAARHPKADYEGVKNHASELHRTGRGRHRSRAARRRGHSRLGESRGPISRRRRIPPSFTSWRNNIAWNVRYPARTEYSAGRT